MKGHVPILFMKLQSNTSGGLNGAGNHDLWIEALRAEKPYLFEPLEFWPVDGGRMEQAIRGVRKGEAVLMGRSAGMRQIWGVTYGDFEPQQPTATISSAMASDHPEAFFNPERRTRPVLAVIGSIHGGETEGIALSMNLIHLMEHGVDLLGRRHDALRDRMREVRLVIVPCLNPDGRAKAAVTHLSGATRDELFLVQQGICQDGSLFAGRKVKEVSPIPPGFLKRMGGYYNDAGVNLQHDDFFGPQLAPENEAVMKLFRRELPDTFITLHAHGAPAAFIGPDAFIAPGYQRKQTEAMGYILSRLVDRGIPILAPEQIVTPPWSFYFQTWLHHMTGSLPLLFEFCHGLEGYTPSSPEQTLDTGLLMIGAWMEYFTHFGARPRSHELYAPVAPAN